MEVFKFQGRLVDNINTLKDKKSMKVLEESRKVKVALALMTFLSVAAIISTISPAIMIPAFVVCSGASIASGIKIILNTNKEKQSVADRKVNARTRLEELLMRLNYREVRANVEALQDATITTTPSSQTEPMIDCVAIHKYNEDAKGMFFIQATSENGVLSAVGFVEGDETEARQSVYRLIPVVGKRH